MIDPQAITVAQKALGRQLSRLRKANGLRQEDLGAMILTSRSSVANIETGHSRGSLDFWTRTDRALGAGGELVRGYGEIMTLVRLRGVEDARAAAAVRSAATGELTRSAVAAAENGVIPQRHPEQLTSILAGTLLVDQHGGPAMRAADEPLMSPPAGSGVAAGPITLEIVTIMAAHESSRHAAQVDGVVSSAVIDQVQAEVWRLARDYAALSPLRLLAEARQARNLAYTALDRTKRPAQTESLYLAAGQLCGLMAVASFDLAVWEAAAEQARSAHVYAELVGHAGLRAWARGTQALIAYWTGQPRQALVHVEAGLDTAPAGAAVARLRCIEARAWSHIGGVPDRITDALHAADDAHAADNGDDELHNKIGGEFGWGPSRHAACAGTALLDAGDPAGAAQRARQALRLLPSDPFGGLVIERAYIDLGAAELALGQLDAADAALAPVWQVAVPQRRHSLTDRLDRIANVLQGERWRGDREASQLRDRIDVFNTEAAARALPSA